MQFIQWGLSSLLFIWSMQLLAQPQAPDQIFSLATAIEIATSRSPKVRGMEARLDEVRALNGVARSEFLPRVGIAAGIEKNPSVSEKSDRLAYGYVSWNLFNGFADRRASQITSFEISKAELELASTKFELAVKVEEQFYAILGAMQSAAEWEEASSLNAVALKDIRQRRSAGIASEGDVVAFEVRQSKIETELADARSMVELTKADFNRLMGHEWGQKITFSGRVPRYGLNEPVDQILASANQNAFSLKESAIDVAKSDVEANRWVSGALPRLDFEARSGWLPLGERPSQATKAGNDAPSTYLLLTAKMDVFSGLSTINERRAAGARKNQSDEKMRESSMDLLSLVERHLRRIIVMEQRLKVEGENSVKTAKYKDTTAREYRAGIKSGLDYAAAIDLVIDSRRRYVDSLLAWHSERFGLESALGRRVAVKEVK